MGTLFFDSAMCSGIAYKYTPTKSKAPYVSWADYGASFIKDQLQTDCVQFHTSNAALNT